MSKHTIIDNNLQHMGVNEEFEYPRMFEALNGSLAGREPNQMDTGHGSYRSMKEYQADCWNGETNHMIPTKNLRTQRGILNIKIELCEYTIIVNIKELVI